MTYQSTQWLSPQEENPADGEVIDWMNSTGEITRGGCYHRGLWFVPPKHDMYIYFVPTLWRHSTEGVRR